MPKRLEKIILFEPTRGFALRLEIYAVNDIPPIGVGKDTQLTGAHTSRLLKAGEFENSCRLQIVKAEYSISSPLIIRPKDRCCKRTKTQIFEIWTKIWPLPTENPMNDASNTFCIPNAP